MKTRVISFIVVIMMLFSCLAVSAFAANSVSVDVTANVTTANPGDEVTFTVSVSGVPAEGISCGELTVEVDSGLTVVGATPLVTSADSNYANGWFSFYGANITSSASLLSITCTVDAGASGSLGVSVSGVELYDNTVAVKALNASAGSASVTVADVTTAPEDTTTAPEETTVAPVVPSNPADVTTVVVPGLVTPEETTTAPEETTTVPVTTEQPPVTTEQPPVTTETAPVTTETAPVTTETAPVTTETAPVTTETVPVTTESTPEETTTTPGGDPSDGLPVGAIIGIVVAVVAVLGGVAVVLWIFVFKKKRT